MIVALNNKSNLTKEEFSKYLNELNTINTNNKVILCPSYINIPIFNSKNIGAANESKASCKIIKHKTKVENLLIVG